MQWITGRQVDIPVSSSPSLRELLKADAARLRERGGDHYLLYVFPQFTAVVLYRVAHRCGKMGFPIVAAMISQINLWITGAGVGWRAEFGPGLFLAHPIGVGIADTVVAGRNLSLGHSVVLGHRSPQTGDDPRFFGTPVIGDDVDIQLKASVVGPVRIGDGAVVGAHALVIKDVPPGATARGVPARNYIAGERID